MVQVVYRFLFYERTIFEVSMVGSMGPALVSGGADRGFSVNLVLLYLHRTLHRRASSSAKPLAQVAV